MESQDDTLYAFQRRMELQMHDAPPPFLEPFQYLMNRDLNQAMNSLIANIPALEEIDKEWAGTAYCCYAHCLKEVGRYQDAVEYAQKGRQLGLNLVGSWYHHDAMVNSLNYIDMLPEAAQAVNEAIRFYESEESSLDMADHLSRKANILKQIAAAISYDSERFEEAKPLIIEAIHSICKSFSIMNPGWEEMKEELNAIFRIAARVGVKREDLGFLDDMANIEKIVETYLDVRKLSRGAVAECHKLAGKAIQEGNRLGAISHFERAIKIAGEREPEDRAYKAFIAYQYGICLMKMHRLDDIRFANMFDPEVHGAIKKIQHLWNETIRLYSTLSADFISDFDRRLPPGLSHAVRTIKQDPLMSIN